MIKFKHQGAITAGIVFLAILVVLVNWTIFGLAIWAIVFGIIDIVAVGANFWAIFWISLGSLIVLANLGTIGGNK